MKQTLVIYHAKCPDGFAGAFTVWKKLGDKAEYFPAIDRHTPPPYAGRDIIIIDFSYPKDILVRMDAEAKSLIIIDHHSSSESDVKSVKNHVFDVNHSGAVLAWSHFNANTPIPALFLYIEQGDLYTFDLSRTLDLKTYIYTLPLEFVVYEKLLADFEDKATLNAFADKGATYSEYRNILLEILAKTAKEVDFEGFRVLAMNAPREFRSDLGNMLAHRKPPFAIVWYPGELNGIVISLRGVGEVNLGAIAKKYGGGGHPDAAAFHWNMNGEFPFSQ